MPTPASTLNIPKGRVSWNVQYHEVKLTINLANEVDGIDKAAGLSVQCFCDYIFLDQDERKRFAQVSHEYLIQQVQFTGDESVNISNTGSRTQNVRLNFNHPCKYLAWVVKGDKHGQYTSVSTANVAQLNTYAESYGPLKSAKLQLNGHDRFAERRGSYFNSVTPYQTLRTRVPAGIYMYPFSLNPGEHQPSGSCNFSRIDNATLTLTFKQANAGTVVANVTSEDITCNNASNLTNLKIFAENYNVFRIMSGINKPVPNSEPPTRFRDGPRGANGVTSRLAAPCA